VSSHFIPTCSTVYRAGLFEKFPDWYRDMPMGDWPLHILNAEHGSYAYLEEVLATYRVHGGGVWSSTDRLGILKKTILACNQIDQYLNGRHPQEINRLIRTLTHEFEMETSIIHKSQGKYDEAFKSLVRAFFILPRFRRRNFRYLISLLNSWMRHTYGTDKKVAT
jgi:hypothetical protein